MPLWSHESAMSLKTSTFESWEKTNKYLRIDCFNTILTCWDWQDIGSKITENKYVHHYGFQEFENHQPLLNTYEANLFIIGSREKILKALTKKPRVSG